MASLYRRVDRATNACRQRDEQEMGFWATRKHGESSVHTAEWRELVWKGFVLCDSIFMIFWKRQKYGQQNTHTHKRVLSKGSGGTERYIGDAQNFLWQQNNSVRYCNGMYTTLYICQKPSNLTAKRAKLNVCNLKKYLEGWGIPGWNAECAGKNI